MGDKPGKCSSTVNEKLHTVNDIASSQYTAEKRKHEWSPKASNANSTE